MSRDVGSTWTFERVEHPVLPLWVVHDDRDQLRWVLLGARESELEERAEAIDVIVEPRQGPASIAARQLGEYLAGARTEFTVDVDPLGTPFECEAWSALQEIPFGETRSYGEQARTIGRERASRAVGRANGKNPLPIIIPCHRVVGSDGRLTGFAGGLEAKRWLLAHEAAQASLELQG
jgi:methylated-DNA-[protein]-cysteine S-methyltransferase